MSVALDFVAQQLRSAYPEGQWQSGGIDRARELAELFINAGIVDLSKLGVIKLDDSDALALIGAGYTVAEIDRFNAGEIKQCGLIDREGRGLTKLKTRGPRLCQIAYSGARDFRPVTVEMVLAANGFYRIPFVFTYENRKIGYLGDANNDNTISNSLPMFQPHDSGPMVAWSARGEGGCSYVLIPTPLGVGVAPLWGRHGDKDFWKQALMLSGTVLSVGFGLFSANVGLSSLLGKAITGAEFAATYPAVSAAIGQTALGTALTGGDVERAVLMSVAGSVGQIGGGYVSGLTDSPFLGKIAGSATAALLAGGDPERAAINAAWQFGVDKGAKMFDDYLNDDVMTYVPTVPQMQFDSGALQFDAGNVDFMGNAGIPTIPTENWTGIINSTSIFDANSGYGFDLPPLVSMPLPPIATGPAPEVVRPLPSTVPGASGTTGWDFAITALKMLPQFVNKSPPMPAPAPRASVTPRNTVDPRMLPPRTPVAGPDGRIYVNNGDGTATTIDTQGRSTTQPIPGAGGAGGALPASLASALSSPVVLGGIALAAILLLRRR